MPFESVALLDATQTGEATFFVTSQVLCEFYSIVTSARRVAQPRSPAEALDAVAGLITFLEILPAPARVVTAWMELLRGHSATGGDVFDVRTPWPSPTGFSLPRASARELFSLSDLLWAYVFRLPARYPRRA
jgi:hypothetical protein